MPAARQLPVFIAQKKTMTRLFLGMESLATVNGGIGLLAALVVRVVGEEVESGRFGASGIVLRDNASARDAPILLTAARKSRLAFVGLGETWQERPEALGRSLSLLRLPRPLPLDAASVFRRLIRNGIDLIRNLTLL
jgi:hypothetical protein